MTNLKNLLIGLLFPQRNSTELERRQVVLNFPIFPLQMKNGDRTYPNVIEPLLNPVKTILQLGKRTRNWVNSHFCTNDGATRLIQPPPLLKNIEIILICPALSSTQNNKQMFPISKLLEHPYTLRKGTHNDNSLILTPDQTQHIRPINPTSVRHLLNNNHDRGIIFLSSVLKTSKTVEVNETFWFTMPQNPGNEMEHTPFQSGNLNEIRELEKLEQLNPQIDTNSRNQFLPMYDWTDSILERKVKQAAETLLVDLHDIFERHCFDIGIIRASKCTSHL